MSQVFTCRCGRRTTEPFMIGKLRLCVICAEWEDPEVVTQRERQNWHRYRAENPGKIRTKDRYGIR